MFHPGKYVAPYPNHMSPIPIKETCTEHGYLPSNGDLEVSITASKF